MPSSSEINSSLIPQVPSDAWIIGDVHGCRETLKVLLKRIDALHGDAHRVFIGDLVGKGPDSFGVMQDLMDQSYRTTVTLGNHDLHLLGCRRNAAQPRASDMTEPLLQLPQGHPWESWLAGQPYVCEIHSGTDEEPRRYRMVHAGIHPSWDDRELQSRLEALTSATRGSDWNWYQQRKGPLWESASTLTRIRCLNRRDLKADFDFTGTPEEADGSLIPWYEALPDGPDCPTYVFGHWARLGWREGLGGHCVDTACVYGGSLTAFQPLTGKVLTQPSCESA